MFKIWFADIRMGTSFEYFVTSLDCYHYLQKEKQNGPSMLIKHELRVF